MAQIDDSSPFKGVRGFMALQKAQELGAVVKTRPEMDDIKEKKDELEQVEFILFGDLGKEELQKKLNYISDIKIKVKEMDKNIIYEDKNAKKNKSIAEDADNKKNIISPLP
jgi:hypothetical protein